MAAHPEGLVMKNIPVSLNDLNILVDNAFMRGATSAAVIETADIVVEDHLADKCCEPRCGNYGQSRSCPPHVAGPSAMRADLAAYSHAVFFRIEVPSHGLYSDGQRELFQLLHDVASGIEKEAESMGYLHSKAFAGGSCKEIFCHDQLDCLVISGKGDCRNPQIARPSMSGFGVHVAKLMERVGWSMNTKRDGESLSSVSGLVLIG